VYPHLNAVKIGKADNVFSRVQQLCHWGKPDFEQSYVVHVNTSDVYKLEGALHLKLAKHKKEMKNYDGYTEFFDFDVLSKLDSILDFFEFEKSRIFFKSERVKVKRKRNYKLSKFKVKMDRRIDAINSNLKLIDNLKRLLIVLNKNKYSCEYVSNRLVIKSSFLRLIKNKSFWFHKNNGSGGASLVCKDCGDIVFIDLVLTISSINDYLHLGISLYS
ncbi:GIY-YIG nuclease family protein, partial [Providencia alcalifaciens]|uniref:GIY-YIG nuclease family protein n=1 Tax=Providencia alcalifaciens TaxID=126385 RepID=UPI002B05869C